MRNPTIHCWQLLRLRVHTCAPSVGLRTLHPCMQYACTLSHTGRCCAPTPCHPTHPPAGPSGSSVREIVRLSGADINSWTEGNGNHRGSRRPARIFVIKVRECWVWLT